MSLLSALLSLGEVLTEEYTWDFDTSATPWVVSLRKADASDGCGIHYARNLVGSEKTMDASALVTRLYPVGYGEGVNQLNIRSVNGGVPYLDADTARTWGIKCRVSAATRIEDAAVLKARAAAVLEGYKNPYITYTAKAIDLHRMTGQSWDNYMPGKRVRVMDGEHGISFAARIVSISKKNLRSDPGSVKLTIANAVRDVADSINTLADRVGIGELYSQGATQIFAIPFADNADPEHPAKMRFYIPSGLERINRMQLSWELSAFRAYETGAAAGGSTTQTSSSGGGSTAARIWIMPSLLNELRSKMHQLNGNELNRVQMKVYDLDDETEFREFAKGAQRPLKVYGTDRYVAYDPQKRIGVTISKLGASQAISVGAYAFALSQLDTENA